MTIDYAIDLIATSKTKINNDLFHNYAYVHNY